jgi:hypothetical protein
VGQIAVLGPRNRVISHASIACTRVTPKIDAKRPNLRARLPSHQQNFFTHPHFATLKTGRGGHRTYRPLAFTEHGAIMAAAVLNSPRAVLMSVCLVRAFVKLRQELASTSILARRLNVLERSVAALNLETRKQFDQVYEAILGLMSSPSKKS